MAELYAHYALRSERTRIRVLFDCRYYLETYPDVRRSGIDPLTHFLLFGAREKRQPHPLFHTAYYVASNPDVAATRVNPLLHFLEVGWQQHRRPNALFDPLWYAQEYRLPEGVNPLLDYIRRRGSGEDVLPAFSLSALLTNSTPKFEIPRLPYPVDVIFRTTEEREETLQSLNNLAGSRFQIPFEVVVITPPSERELTRNILEICQHHCWTLVSDDRERNAMRRALALHVDRDVVLFEAGTEVAGDWLDRLAAAAYSAPGIGTAAPFCNRAGPTGYPLPHLTTTLAQGVTTEAIDQDFRAGNGARTAVLGAQARSLTYLRREYISQGGLLPDGSSTGVAVADGPFFVPGWKHVLAAGIFAYHPGKAGNAAASADCAGAAASAGRNDVAAPLRFIVSAARLKKCGRPVILAVSHALGGGVSESIVYLSRALRHRVEFLIVMPADNAVIVECPNPDYAFSLAIDAERDYSVLLEVLRRCGVVRMHIHHTHGYRLDLDRLRRDLGVPFDFTAHDYYAICPQFHLTNATGGFCGEPGEAGCNRCLAERPLSPSRSIQDWRRENSWLLRGADRLIVPSGDTSTRLARYVPDRPILVVPHPEPPIPQIDRDAPRLAADEPLRIAILGVLSNHKGLAKVRDCARLGQQRRLLLEFTLVGFVDKSLRPRAEPFRQTGQYTNASLPDLLAQVNPHLVWFPGEAPETYSFALSAALRAGLPVVVPNIGALPERVAGLTWAWVTPLDWDPICVNAFFSEIRERNFLTRMSPAPTAGRDEPKNGFYESAYLEREQSSIHDTID